MAHHHGRPADAIASLEATEAEPPLCSPRDSPVRHRPRLLCSYPFMVTSTTQSLRSQTLGLIIEEEAWFDSVSILESDSDEDFSSVNGDFAAVSSNQIGTQLQKLEQYINMDSEANEPVKSPEMGAPDIVPKLRPLERLRMTREGRLEKQEKALDSPILYVTPNCMPRFASSSSCNKITPLPSTSPQAPQKRKSAVIQLSIKRKSFDGDQTTEICASKRYLYRPRAGLSVPCSSVEKPVQEIRRNPQPQHFHPHALLVHQSWRQNPLMTDGSRSISITDD